MYDKKRQFNRLSKFLKYILLIVSTLYIFLYIGIVYFRIRYPFELQWMEGSMVDHVRRILDGKKLYVETSLEFIPHIYTPLYFYLSAAISGMSIIGIGFLSERLISFISSLGSLFVIFFIVQQETGSKFTGILASCLFAATFHISGASFDLARVDSLFLFLLLISIYLLKFATSNKSFVLAGMFISLSFLTKQTALLISLPIMLCCILLNKRSALYFVGTAVLIMAGSTLLLNNIHAGWYNYYLFNLPGQHPFVKSMFIDFWLKDVLSPLPIASIMSIFYLLTQFYVSGKKNFLFYLLIAAGMLGGAWVSRLHLGGTENVLMPAYAAISILFGLALHELFDFIETLSVDKKDLLKIFIYLICILQFSSGQLRYNPFQQVPTKEDLKAGRKFIDLMAQMKGEIFVPDHCYLPTLAGKNSHAHGSAIRASLIGDKGKIRDSLVSEIRSAIKGKRFSAIIIDSHIESTKWIPININEYYLLQGRIFDDEDVFWPVTGMKTRPEFIYVPKK